VNSQFDVDAKFTLAENDEHTQMVDDDEYCLAYNPPWLVPVCAAWTKARHWPDKDCLITDYAPTLGVDGHLDISFNAEQVERYEAYRLLYDTAALSQR